MGAIIGGVLGGIAFLVGITLITWFILKRRRASPPSNRETVHYIQPDFSGNGTYIYSDALSTSNHHDKAPGRSLSNATMRTQGTTSPTPIGSGGILMTSSTMQPTTMSPATVQSLSQNTSVNSISLLPVTPTRPT